MKRFALALLLVALFAADADACKRCGILGRGCRFSQSSHVVVADSFGAYGNYGAYAAPAAASQTFNFVNNGYGGLPISAQGQTVYAQGQPYGFQASASAYAVDSNAVLAQFARMANAGIDGYTVTAQGTLAQQGEVNKILAQGHSATAALLAAKGADSPPTVQSFSVRVQGGKATLIEQGGGGASVSALALPGEADASLAVVIKTKCFACHSGGTLEAGLDLSKPIDGPLLAKIWDRVTNADPAKVMPKKGPRLSGDELRPFARALDSFGGK